MKKILTYLSVVACITLTSCGENNGDNEQNKFENYDDFLNALKMEVRKKGVNYDYFKLKALADERWQNNDKSTELSDDEIDEIESSGIPDLPKLKEIISKVQLQDGKISLVWDDRCGVSICGSEYTCVSTEDTFNSLLDWIEKMKNDGVEIEGLQMTVDNNQLKFGGKKFKRNVWKKNLWFWKAVNKYWNLFDHKDSFTIEVSRQPTSSGGWILPPQYWHYWTHIAGLGVCEINYKDVVEKSKHEIVVEGKYKKKNVRGKYKEVEVRGHLSIRNDKVKGDFSKVFKPKKNENNGRIYYSRRIINLEELKEVGVRIDPNARKEVPVRIEDNVVIDEVRIPVDQIRGICTIDDRRVTNFDDKWITLKNVKNGECISVTVL